MSRSEDAAEQQPAKKTAKKAAKKTAKKTAKKAAKKTAKKTQRKATRKRTAKKATSAASTAAPVEAPAAPATPQEPANPYAAFDRSKLRDKMRVFQLAKEIGVPSKDLIVALSDLGVVKVAQSSLTRAESEQLLDALSNQPTTNAEQAEDDRDDKLRDRVRKDVANEITQIERKVEAELTDRADEAEDAEGDEVEPAQDVVEDDEDDDTDALSDPEDVAELLADVEPEITPAPAEDAGAYAPVFKAPSRSGRRRASRPSGSEKTEVAAEAAIETPAETETPAEPAAQEERAPKRSRRSKADNRSDHKAERKAEHKPEPQVEVVDEPKAIKGSSRLEAQRRRRSEKREEQKKRSRIVSQAEFLARRESVTRTMVVRERDRHDGPGRITQVGVLEDGLLVEHFVTSENQASMIGNIYLGRVQNVLPSMEAAFIDIGQGRNGVLYAGEVDWKAAGLGGRSRRIEHALKSGDQVVVQVTKDPVGHKGARLTTQISLAGRYLVYVPGGRSAGISRKLPAPERKRLKEVLNNVVPGKGGAIIRTAAEGVPEEAIAADVNRLHTQWQAIQDTAEKEKRSKGAKPVTLYEEPNLLVKVVRDLFNEDFTALVVDGWKAWNTVHAYVESVAPDLLDRLERFDRSEHDGKDAFEAYRVDEQLQKALARVVWLPSGGSLVIDRTEAMTVIDVNTGKFTGAGGSLEETVTSNNLEAAEEIVRQIRLRDIGGIIIIDFIDMILPENQDLVLRRLNEALGRDRTKHQVSEVTSLGLVQMTRKRLGTGLLETFSEPCEHCDGRGIVLTEDPVDHDPQKERDHRASKRRRPIGAHPAAKGLRETTPETAPEDAPETSVDPQGSSCAHLDEEELDQIAGSVVAAGSADDTDSDEPQQSASEGQKRSRRRGRRGGSRGRGRQGQQSQRDDQQDQPREEQQEQQSEHTQPEQTFEEAVAEFESSPRRKRRTRGNSRSDHRPRREDFEAPAAQQEPEQDEPQQEAEQRVEERREPAAKAQPKRSAAQSGSRSRGRRRATRKSNASAQVQDRNQAERASEPKAPSRSESAPKRAPRQEQQSESPARRGRRRATRRSSSS